MYGGLAAVHQARRPAPGALAATGDVLLESDQVAGAKPAAEQFVELEETGWDRISRRGPIGNGVDAAKQD